MYVCIKIYTWNFCISLSGKLQDFWEKQTWWLRSGLESISPWWDAPRETWATTGEDRGIDCWCEVILLHPHRHLSPWTLTCSGDPHVEKWLAGFGMCFSGHEKWLVCVGIKIYVYIYILLNSPCTSNKDKNASRGSGCLRVQTRPEYSTKIVT